MQIGRRYQLLDQIGAGGMGVVYRALDRLTGQAVALKQVLFKETLPDEIDFRLALEQEFRTLASLRHPNIISVLDYGFHRENGSTNPYFTMELLPAARTITQAGSDQTMAVQISLIVQTLHALEYLHRRGILHRDLKPANVLVTFVNGQPLVKLVDFGLAVARDAVPERTVGTLQYMAPEVLMGGIPTESADLYSVGMMAYEIFCGEHPFADDDVSKLLQDILQTVPDVSILNIDNRLKAPLARLLAKSPEDRYHSASDVLSEYFTSINAEVAQTTATRESFLQAAAFVGRDVELDRLGQALKTTIRTGQGTAWLVAGESGVGKSRLLDELRALALVNGALVLRGQAVSEGGKPYQALRDVLRRLCLQIELNDFEASVLKPLIPDIGVLLSQNETPRLIPDAEELDARAAKERLLEVIEGIFWRLDLPMVVIVEDIHWGVEELAVLERLSRQIDMFQVLLIASYRDDEKPLLAQELPHMRLLKLNRLAPQHIAELSASMLGEGGKQQDVVDLIRRETEGNVFFIIEVVRTLAEEAGQLEWVGARTLPERVFAGGIELVVKRRLGRVSPEGLILLEAAAVAGRRLDLAIIQTLHAALLPAEKTLEYWLTECTNAAVLTVQDEHWQFAHDKLRESLLNSLTPTKRAKLHQLVAMALENTYPNHAEYAADLAHHWGAAGNTAQEFRYAVLAGEQALKIGANADARTILQRAAELSEHLEPSILRRAVLHRQYAEAIIAFGDLLAARVPLFKATQLLGKPFPSVLSSLMPNLMGQALYQIRTLLRYPVSKAETEPLLELNRIHQHLAEINFFGGDTLATVYCALRALNTAEQVPPSGELALAYASMCVAAGYVPLHSLARRYRRRALEVIAIIDAENTYTGASTYLPLGLYALGTADWASVENFAQQGMNIFERVGHKRRWGEFANLLAHAKDDQGDLQAAANLWGAMSQVAETSNNRVHQGWSRVNRAMGMLRQGGIVTEATRLLEDGLRMQKLNLDKIATVNTYGALAQAYLRLGLISEARQYADTGAALAVGAPTSVTAMHGYLWVAEAYLTLWEQGDVAAAKLAYRAIKNVGAYCSLFVNGKARWLTYQGWAAHLSGKSTQATNYWQAAEAQATAVQMPFEEALAYYQHGRHRQGEEQQMLLKQAQGIAARLGMNYELEQIAALGV